MSATDWNTNAILYRRISSLALSESLVISRPPNMTLPFVGLSSAPRILIRVVLPLPERPLRIVSLPFSISMLIFFSAFTTLPSPILKSRHRSSVESIVSIPHGSFITSNRIFALISSTVLVILTYVIYSNKG